MEFYAVLKFVLKIYVSQLSYPFLLIQKKHPHLVLEFYLTVFVKLLFSYLHIRKNTKSVEGITAGPPPQIFITEDTEETNYKNTYSQIITSVRMCIEDLCITPENICIVAFNEPELLSIQQKLEVELKIESALIYKNFSFKNNEGTNRKIRLCTLREIKGIDCAVLLFMITDQSKQQNNGGFMSELKANAIYTCITRAMYLLQVFVPKNCGYAARKIRHIHCPAYSCKIPERVEYCRFL